MISAGYVFDRNEYWIAHRSGVSDFFHHDEGLIEFLDSISSSIQKHIFTNCREQEAETLLNALGVRHHFTRIYGADFLGDSCKPERSSFLAVLSDLGILPSQVIFFEDSIKNLMEGRAMGMRTVLVHGMTAEEEAKAGGGGGQLDVRAMVDVVVTSLSDRDAGKELKAKLPDIFHRSLSP